MPRLSHGAVITTDQIQAAFERIAQLSNDVPFGAFVLAPPKFSKFAFLFPELQTNPDNLLPEGQETRDALIKLGQTMRDVSNGSSEGDSSIPAAYTYLGQFIDHDITVDLVSAPELADLLKPELTPLGADFIQDNLHNGRTPMLDLDSVYGLPAPYQNERLGTGKATRLDRSQAPFSNNQAPFLRPEKKNDDNHDVPRDPRHKDPNYDRAALIGDPRNDENTIIAQLHTAFLRAHNALVDKGLTFRQARALLVQHYQHIIIHDFLRRVVNEEILDGILKNGNRVFRGAADPLYMPLEFSVAAYRFGHSMVRASYNFNLNFNRSGDPGTTPASLGLLFTFTAMSGQLGNETVIDFDTLPENWIIEWERFVDSSANFEKARKLDTRLVEPLFELTDIEGKPLNARQQHAGSLAVRNLLRGYLLRMPTGQAVAGTLNLPALTPQEIVEAADGEQADVLREAGFLERTPLWYYLLAEAAHGGGERLGPVGSTIVAEVLIGLIRKSPYSILTRDWTPSLGRTPGRFELPDLLQLAGVHA